jgi:hypothetical protein
VVIEEIREDVYVRFVEALRHLSNAFAGWLTSETPNGY